MSSSKLFSLSAKAIVSGLASRSFALDDLMSHFIERTKKVSPLLNSHVFFSESAISKQVDALKKISNPSDYPLFGVPVLIKDNICTTDMPTTCGSKILAGYVPQYDATVISRLRQAGAVIFGKTNQDEFAMGSSNENSAYGPVKNPWDLERVPGGSSGGSAAAVAAELVPVALGSDTGGSIRQPASFCGVVGLKPTYGAVSRYGLVAYGSSLDCIGPITRSVEDATMVFDVISGYDPKDATSLNTQSRQLPDAEAMSSRKRIGVISELIGTGNDLDTIRSFKEAVIDLQNLGAVVEEVSLPEIEYSIAMYYLIATAEASSNLARFDGIRFGHRSNDPSQSLKELYLNSRSEGFGKEVKQRIMLGTFALSSGYYDAYYVKALNAREQLKAAVKRLFSHYDFLISPTSPTTAFKLGEKIADPLSMYLSDIGTIAANLAGIPAISVPCGFSEDSKLPIGLQIMAPWNKETSLLQLARQYEQTKNWSERYKPNV